MDQGFDPRTGKRRQRWTTHKTRREAEAFLAATLAQTQIGAGVPSSRVRVGEFLAEWLEASKGRIRPTTWRVYSYCVRQHIVPDLGGIPLLRLTSQVIEGWLSQIQAKQLSAAAVHRAFRLLRPAVCQAVSWALVARGRLSFVRACRVLAARLHVGV